MFRNQMKNIGFSKIIMGCINKFGFDRGRGEICYLVSAALRQEKIKTERNIKGKGCLCQVGKYF